MFIPVRDQALRRFYIVATACLKVQIKSISDGCLKDTLLEGNAGFGMPATLCSLNDLFC